MSQNVNAPDSHNSAMTPMTDVVQERDKKLLDWLATIDWIVTGAVWFLIQITAKYIPEEWIVLAAAFCLIPAGAGLFHLVWAKQTPQRGLWFKFKVLLLGCAPLIIFGGAWMYLNFHWGWSPTDAKAIEYTIATEHELRGKDKHKTAERIMNYYSADAQIEYDEVKEGVSQHYFFDGMTKAESGGAMLLDYYTNDDSVKYLYVQHRKEFIHHPQLCDDRRTAVAMTKTHFRVPEQHLDWDTTDRCQVWVVKQVGTKWLIHRFYGNLDSRQAQILFEKVKAGSH